MRILCVTDQFEKSNHSSIEGIFGTYLREMCDVYITYFSSTLKQSYLEDNRVYIPYAYKRRNICKEINKLISLKEIDIVIVRNLFPILKNVLKQRRIFDFRIGFWHSFPHAFRRLFEAKEENRSILRKKIEYRIRTHMEKNLINKCDFLIVMSNEFKKTFYQDMQIDCLALPMGVHFYDIPSYHPDDKPLKKFIYTGAVDSLRKTDLIVAALSELEENFLLDIFTKSNNEITRKIMERGNRKINIYSPLPRKELFQKMANYDVGIGLIPSNELYNVSSPTKTLEYYSVGIPALINYLPEYVSLFDDNSAFFCDFTKIDIQRKMREILRLPKKKLFEMGINGKKIVKEQRDYRILSAKLYNFLGSS